MEREREEEKREREERGERGKSEEGEIGQLKLNNILVTAAPLCLGLEITAELIGLIHFTPLSLFFIIVIINIEANRITPE